MTDLTVGIELDRLNALITQARLLEEVLQDALNDKPGWREAAQTLLDTDGVWEREDEKPPRPHCPHCRSAQTVPIKLAEEAGIAMWACKTCATTFTGG